MKIAVPAEHVDQIIEYELCTPLPLAQRWIGGLGIWEKRVLASIALTPPGSTRPVRRRAKGVLLRHSRRDIDWALEISGIAGFVQVSLQPMANRPAGIAPFLRRAAAADGRPIAWLDVPLMFATLPTSPSE
jgi:chemotaxis signal transduction protein